jgi:hypothetical protein
MANEVRVRASVVDQVSGPLGKIRDNFKLLGDASTRSIAAGNLAAIGLAKGFSLLGSAAGAAVGFVEDAVRAAADEEVGVQRLTTSLKANVDGWNGNTDAIEERIHKSEELAFSDGALRDSLSLLVASTHDVNKAFEMQQTAMDLARFKGIDLQSASEALVKVEGGQYRMLKSLGIQLRDGATQTEALAAVQKVAGGQAEAFGKTTAGAMERAKIKIEDLSENIGQHLLPDMLSQVVDHEYMVSRATDDTIAKFDGLSDAELRVKASGDGTFLGFKSAQETLDVFAASAVLATRAITDQDRANDAVYDSLEAMRGATDDAADSMDGATDSGKDLFRAFDNVRRAAKDADSALQDLSGALYDADIKAGDLASTQQDLADLMNGEPANKHSPEWVEWNGKVAEARQRIFDLGYEIAKLGGDQALYKWLLTQQTAIGNTDAKTQGLITRLRALALLSSVTAPVTYVNDYIDRLNTSLTAAGVPRASGGPVDMGRTYLVGEQGPEIFVPKQAGTILPNDVTESAFRNASSTGVAMSGASPGNSAFGLAGGASDGRPVEIPVVIDGREIARIVDRNLYYASRRSRYLPD